MATLGKWFFRYKGAALSTIYSVTVSGCSNDVPGILKVASSNCYDGFVYHIVATARNNARYASDLSASTCGSGALSIIEQTFTADSSVTGITCAASASPAYDCINGACTLATKYNTPGLYTTLGECQTNCGTGKCSGVCIASDDWATIEGLSSQLKSRNCS